MNRCRIIAFTLLAIFAIPLRARADASQASKQSDVFKSIQDSVGEKKEVSDAPAILLALGGAAVMVVLVVLSRREQKVAKKPEPLNSPAKLAKEILREVSLKAVEVRQLKTVADTLGAQLGEVPDPMTLLLCPSLLARGLKNAPARLDRKLLAQVVRRMKLTEINQRTEPPAA